MSTLVYRAADGRSMMQILQENRSISLGRDPSNDIVFKHPSISRHHAQICCTAGEYFIEDQNSRNEVFVNGSKVKKHQLKDGDVIVLGLARDNALRFSLNRGEEVPEFSRSAFDFSKAAFNNLRNLQMLIGVSETMTTSLELDEVFERVLNGVLEISSGMRAMIILKNKSGEMEVAYRKNTADSDSEGNETFSRSIINRVLESRQPFLINDTAVDLQLQNQASIGALELHSMVGIPLLYSQKYVAQNRSSDPLMGILYVDSKTRRRRFNEEDLNLLLALSYQAAICIENAQIHHDLRENYVALVTSLAQAVELKDRYTRGHSELVSRYAVAMAERLSLTMREIEDIGRGALLHDVGKIGIDESILNKSGKLTEEEAELIRQHPRFGAQILQPIPYMSDVRDMVLHHHERMDGNGYPDGLKGDEIKLGARIVAIADVFEALTSRRSYRRALSSRGVVKHLETEAESRLDPELVKLFINIFREAEFKKGAVRPKSNATVSFNERKQARLKTGAA